MSNNTELLSKVKAALGITGTHQDETLLFYIDDVKAFMIKAGVPPRVVESTAAFGVIARGVADLWNYGNGDTKLSEFFQWRVAQLTSGDPFSLQDLTITENGEYTHDADHDGIGSVTVDVKPDLVDITVRSNHATYERSGEYRGYKKIYVDVPNELQIFLDFRDTAYHLFASFEGTNVGTILDGIVAPSSTQEMFVKANNLTEAPMFDTYKVQNMQGMFHSNYALVNVPLYDTSYCNNVSYMFRYDRALKVIPAFDFYNVQTTSYFVDSCTALEEIWIKNIRASIQVGSGTTYGHKLTLESLLSLIRELCDTGATKTLTIGSANLKKLASVYVRHIEITDEMRAEDGYIDDKLPFEVCESTDEGASLITDYALFKNWEIK